MEIICPECQAVMQYQRDSVYVCVACHQHYQQTTDCPTCQQPLQRLQACGAVNYFCTHGHGMVSKKQVIYGYIPLPDSSA